MPQSENPAAQEFDIARAAAHEDDELDLTPTPPKAEPAATTQPATPKHSPRSLRLAREYGISDGELAKLSPEDLEDRLEGISRQLLADNRAFHREQVIRGNNQTPKEQAPLPPPKPKDEIEDILGELADPEKGLDPRVVKLFRHLNAKGQAPDLSELQETVKILKETETKRQQSHMADVLDAGFSELGETYAKLVGVESGLDLDPQGPQMKKRLAIIQAAGITQEDTPRKIKAKIKASAEALYGDVLPTQAPAQQPNTPADPYASAMNGSHTGNPRMSQPAPTKQAPPKDPSTGRFVSKEDWEQAATARPTHREFEEPKGVRRAEKAVGRVLAEQDGGSDGYSADQDILNLFPAS